MGFGRSIGPMRSPALSAFETIVEFLEVVVGTVP
jgi:hypothetical protein